MPTLVNLIVKKVNVASFCATAEEEIQKEIKFFNIVLIANVTVHFTLLSLDLKNKILNKNKSNLDLIFRDILIPPPKLI